MHHTVEMTILGKRYVVACQRDERDRLLAASEILNHQIDAAKEYLVHATNEKIAVMVALNLATELLPKEEEHSPPALQHKITHINRKIAQTLKSA